MLHFGSMEKAHALTSFRIKNFDDDSGAIRCDPGEGLLLLLLVFPVLLLLPFFAAGRPVRTVCATAGGGSLVLEAIPSARGRRAAQGFVLCKC